MGGSIAGVSLCAVVGGCVQPVWMLSCNLSVGVAVKLCSYEWMWYCLLGVPAPNIVLVQLA